MGKRGRERQQQQHGQLVEGARLEVEVERILPGGMGLAHAKGQTLLVALAAPSDRVRVEVRQVRGRVAFAHLLEVLEAGRVRVEPPCPYFGRCGGCDFQQLTYAAQLSAKVEIIRDCLRRVARVEPPAEIRITPSPVEWHYRSRAQWQYDGERLGYFARGSHAVCDVSFCPVVVPELQQTLEALRAQAAASTLPAEGGEFQAVAGDAGAVSLVPPPADEAPRELLRTVRGERYSFDASCFFQINHELLEPLLDEALRHACEGGRSAVDLYCGVGLFTLPLARLFARVDGVEGHAAACAYARRNLDSAGLANASIHIMGVAQWLREHARRLAPVDFVLLDPPRAGADGGAVEGILALAPRRISYVSCDPATLARDLKILLADGYTLTSVSAFDLFPQTHHVETVVHLSK